MSQWFPTLDSAVGGAADVVEDSGSWVFGGIGSTISNVTTGTASTAADVGGEFLGPVVNTWIKILALVLGAVVVIRVI